MDIINLFLAIDGQAIFLIIIGAFLVGILLWQGSNQKKAQADFMAMLDTLRAGMRVKMASGVIGRITEIREEAPGFKTILIDTGDEKNHSLLLYEITAVQGIVNEEAIMQLNIKKNLQDLEKADAERKANEKSEDEKTDDPHKVQITTLNGEEFDAAKYVAKRNDLALGAENGREAGEKKTKAKKSKTKK
jgi:preprotein translocase subunit YajC